MIDDLAGPDYERLITEVLLRKTVEYGNSSDESLIPDLMSLYTEATHKLAPESRRDLLLAVARGVEERRVGPNALMPFLFLDPDFSVVSSASIVAAPTWPGVESDPMLGVRELLAKSKEQVIRGDEERAVALLTGVILLGDRRVMDVVGDSWRVLSEEGRTLLTRSIRRPYAAIVDWLLDWLEDCESGEFGTVAAALASLPTGKQMLNVVEVIRAFPTWSVPDDQVMQVTGEWSFNDYGERIRTRLLQLAADETSPRVMHEVLQQWGIRIDRRLHPEVVMSAPGGFEEPRDLSPVLASEATEQGGSRIFTTPLLLENRDFTTRSGKLLFAWAHFNPFGPTWSCLGLLQTRDSHTAVLFYRMLNPFRQTSAALGLVQEPDGRVPMSTLGRLAAIALQSEFPTLHPKDKTSGLVGSSPPSLLDFCLNDEEFNQLVVQGLNTSPEFRSMDLGNDARLTREFLGRPWDRATADIQSAPSPFSGESPSTAAFRAAPTPHERSDWLRLVLSDEHRIPTLVNFPTAWHGSIERVGGQMAEDAYTFWQLDDFLSRFGYPIFREVAEWVEGMDK